MATDDPGQTKLSGKGRRRFNARQTVWAMLALIFAASLVLSIFTVRNYAEVAKAALLTDVVTDESAVLFFNSTGSLESVEMTLRFTVTNPSQKELKVWVIAYKGWIRDLPNEEGADDSRWRVDGEFLVNETPQLYFPVFTASYPYNSPEIIVSGNSNITITERLYMNRTEYPDIMQNFESIMEYVTGQGGELEWQHYTCATILIRDIPSYVGPNKDANVIKRYEGSDITPGVGGAGP